MFLGGAAGQALAAAQDSPLTALPADLTGATPLHLTGALLAEFEAYIVHWLAELDVPGAAVVVVQNGRRLVFDKDHLISWSRD